MNLNLLRTFVSVVEEGNFSRAANRLHLSQPAVSMQMQSLVQELGVALFLRVGHRVELTEAGNILHRQARQLLQGWHQTQQELDSLRLRLQGRIEMGASSVPADYLLPPLLADFSRQHPDLEVRMLTASSQDTIEALVQGRLDLAVAGDRPQAPGLESTVLFTDRLVAVFAPEHSLNGKTTLSVRDILAHPLVMRTQGSATRKVLEQALGPKADKLRPVIELGSSRAVLEVVARGLGLAVVSRQAAGDYVEAGRLVQRPIADLALDRNFWLIYAVNALPTPARELVKFLTGGAFSGRGD